MITNLQKKANRDKLKADFQNGVWPYPNIVPARDIAAGKLSYASLAATIGPVIPAPSLLGDSTFADAMVLINGRKVASNHLAAFRPLIITKDGAEFLRSYTNETVYKSFGVYIWMCPAFTADWRTVDSEIDLV